MKFVTDVNPDLITGPGALATLIGIVGSIYSNQKEGPPFLPMFCFLVIGVTAFVTGGMIEEFQKKEREARKVSCLTCGHRHDPVHPAEAPTTTVPDTTEDDWRAE
jgi:hypothetical protein